MTVEYNGTLGRDDSGAQVLKGTWINMLEETTGVFGCRLEPVS